MNQRHVEEFEISGEKVLGAVEFGDTSIREIEPGTFEMLEGLGRQLGQRLADHQVDTVFVDQALSFGLSGRERRHQHDRQLLKRLDGPHAARDHVAKVPRHADIHVDQVERRVFAALRQRRSRQNGIDFAALWVEIEV